MISYLDTVKNLSDEVVFHRGQRLFLEGKVLKYKELNLDYWREYEVLGSKGCVYYVKIPVIHLALSADKMDKADLALSEVVHCTCPYFEEFGFCKHVVAVCTALENEFSINLKKTKNKLYKSQSDEILETIFEADFVRKQREFEAQLESYLEGILKNTDFKWLDELVLLTLEENPDHTSFFERLEVFINCYISKYESEGYICNLILKSLLFDSRPWWKFWQKFFNRLTLDNYIKINVKLWEMQSVRIFRNLKDDVTVHLKNLSVDEKKQILKQLQKNFSGNQEIWINFVIQSHLYQWLEENVLNLDPETLIKFAKEWPFWQEQIEPILFEKIKLWIEFLPKDDYDKIAQAFNDWLKYFGAGENYLQAYTYLKQIHKKKKSLLSKIKK